MTPLQARLDELDALQTAGFLLDHLRHHRRQLHRIRNTPGFPTSGPAPIA